MLRRLVVNGDDKHDYLSKGATLQIRDTGVYAAHGTEDRGKVEWKFEYLVTPRISPTTGEDIPNEKVSAARCLMPCLTTITVSGSSCPLCVTELL